MNHKLRVYNFFSPLSLLLHVQHINSHNGFWRRIQLDGDEKCKMDFKNPLLHTYTTHADISDGGEENIKLKGKWNRLSFVQKKIPSTTSRFISMYN